MKKSVVIGIACAVGLSMTGGTSLAASYEVDLDASEILLQSQSVAYWDTYNSSTACGMTESFTPLYDGMFEVRCRSVE